VDVPVIGAVIGPVKVKTWLPKRATQGSAVVAVAAAVTVVAVTVTAQFAAPPMADPPPPATAV
jgi:hypothetical protein